MGGAILYIMLVHVLCGRLWLWVVLFCILCLYMYCVIGGGYGTGCSWWFRSAQENSTGVLPEETNQNIQGMLAA